MWSKTRLALCLLSVAAAVLTAVLVHDYLTYKQDRHDRSIELGREAGIRVAEALDGRLSGIATRARRYAGELARMPDESRLLDSIRRESRDLPLLLGVTVAFEPGVYRGKERFAPFFNKRQDKFQFVEDSYDYTERELETARWYGDVIESGQARWSKPYFAEAAQAMVVDYGVPLRDRRGEVIGMVDFTITLSDFAQIVDELSVGESGYGFTFEPGGAILAHPDPENLMENIFQLKDGKDEAILATLRNETEGVVAYNSTYTYRYSWFFFRELPSTGWKSVLVFAEDDLLGASDLGRKKLINICLGASVLLLLLLAFALRPDRYHPARLWWMVAAVSIVIIGNIVVIWYLNLTTDFSLLENDQEPVVNRSILNKYISRFDEDLFRLEQTDYHEVPVGIFIESYEMRSFEASLIGRLWMKYPKMLSATAPADFYFPDVSAIETRGLVAEKISEVDQGAYTLLSWRFRVTLEQDFSYRQYPFEQNDIRVRLLYPDFSKNILLVPDLDSYAVLNPSSRPGLNPDIRVPSSLTVASFWSFDPVDYKTSFGSDTLVRTHPALSFNIKIKRIWQSPFIANIIPILIVALIMFIVLYVSSTTEQSRVGLTTMNVIQSSAGFLFILVLTHVNERARIETPEIAYIELFFFTMYLFISLQAIALAALFQQANWRVLTLGDNLVLKLLFWPLLLAIWLAVTLLRFY